MDLKWSISVGESAIDDTVVDAVVNLAFVDTHIVEKPVEDANDAVVGTVYDGVVVHGVVGDAVMLLLLCCR